MLLYRNICHNYRKITDATYPLTGCWSGVAIKHLEGVLPFTTAAASDQIFFSSLNYLLECSANGIYITAGNALQMGTYNDDPINTDFPKGMATNYFINHPMGTFRPSILHYIYLYNNYIIGDTISIEESPNGKMDSLQDIILLARRVCRHIQILQQFNPYQIALGCIQQVRGRKVLTSVLRHANIDNFERIVNDPHSVNVYHGAREVTVSDIEIVTTIPEGDSFIKVCPTGNIDYLTNIGGHILTELTVYKTVRSDHIPQLIGVVNKRLDIAISHAGTPTHHIHWRKLASTLAKALNSLHSRGIVHRDLSVYNCLIKGDAIKMIDFGMSNHCAIRMNGKQLLLGGNYVTTLPYRAPEVWMNKSYDWRIDIWSLGILLLQKVAPHLIPQKLEDILVLFSCDELVGNGYWLTNPLNTQPIKAEKIGISNPEIPDLVWDCLQLDPYSRPSAQSLVNHPGLIDTPDDGYSFIKKLRKTPYGKNIPLKPPVNKFKSALRSIRVNFERAILRVKVNVDTFIYIVTSGSRVYVSTVSTLFVRSTLVVYPDAHTFNSTISEYNTEADIRYIFHIFDRVYHLPTGELDVDIYPL